MASRDRQIAVVAAIAGILGAVVGAVGGAVTNGLMTAHVQQEERRLTSALESFKFDETDKPVEVLQVKQFLYAQRDLSVVSATSIGRMAQAMRRYPKCWNSLADFCEDFYVEQIQIMRDELKSGQVAADDIKVLLHGKFATAGKALHNLQSGPR